MGLGYNSKYLLLDDLLRIISNYIWAAIRKIRGVLYYLFTTSCIEF